MEPSALQNGTVVDRYTVESLIGEGGMAVVFRVRHNTLGTLHALKVLTLSSRAIRERLKQEGQFQARLQHPNVVSVTDVIDLGGNDGLIMEFVDGPTLDQLLRQQRLTLPQADELAAGILAGVAEAHRLGYVHRDLKPGNVLLKVTPRGYLPKVADFGLAKSFGEGSDPGKARTRTGSTMGTPHYMSPEQVRDSKNVGPRSDIFALGAILYEMVAGRRAFEGSDLLEIFNAVANAQCTPIRELVPDLPARMEQAIQAAMRTDPRDRPETVEALAAIWRGSNGATLLGDSAPGFDVSSLAGATFPLSSRGTESGPRVNETWAAAETLPDASVTPPSVAPNSVGPTLGPASMSRSRFAWALGLGGGVAMMALASLVVLVLGAGGLWYWLVPVDGPVVGTDGSPHEMPAVVGTAVAGTPDPVPGEPPAPEEGTPVVAGTAPVVVPSDANPPIPEVGSAEPMEEPPAPSSPSPDPAPRPTPAVAKVQQGPPRGGEEPVNDGPELIGMQASDDPQERMKAVANLGKRADDDAVRLLDHFVRTDTSPEVRREAWTIVVDRYDRRFGDVGLLETTVVWQMSHGNARDGSEAVEAFGRFGTDPSLLVGAIRHKSKDVRACAAAVVTKIAARADDGFDYDALLAPLLGDPDPFVQRKANQALSVLR